MTAAADERGTSRRERIVLAFTGDLETTVAVQWLSETCGADVVALIVDFGHSRDLEDIRNRALALGALRAHVLDVREEFARAYLLPALRAGVLGDGSGRLAAAMGHAAVASKLVEVAVIEQANRVAHGGVTSAPRIAAAVHALKPDFHVLAPASEWGMSRDALREYGAKRRVRLPVEGAMPHVLRSADREGGAFADHSRPEGEHVPHDGGNHGSRGGMAPHAEPAVVDIAFRAGTPVALNGVNMPLLDLMGSLDFLAGKNGVGRRDVYETPGVTVLAAAHEDLRQRATAEDLTDFSRTVGSRYAELVEQGRWFSVLRTALDAYVDRAEQVVNGIVRLRLYEGLCDIVDGHIADEREDDDNAVVGAVRHRA